LKPTTKAHLALLGTNVFFAINLSSFDIATEQLVDEVSICNK
jgi:hypothetical protein